VSKTPFLGGLLCHTGLLHGPGSGLDVECPSGSAVVDVGDYRCARRFGVGAPTFRYVGVPTFR
jgi:hypothetical protein